jgi:hypothetical protein
MRDMLAMTASALMAVAEGAGVPDHAQIRFTGEWAHLGVKSVGDILTEANAMLALPTTPCNGCGQDILIDDHPGRPTTEEKP